MRFDVLNKDNFLLFAIKNYENPRSCTYEDFEDDLKRFGYIKKLLNKYLKNKVIRTHLILNHLIVIYNVWGEAATALLFYKLGTNYWPCLKAFLVFLNRWPDNFLEDLPTDKEIERQLGGI